MNSKPLKLTIVSGKGGVGKSMLCSALAMLACKEKKLVAVDCDADGPNLAIWLNETENWHRTIPVMASNQPEIDLKKCNGCGVCFAKCRALAITKNGRKAEVSQLLCDGCGVCEAVCPKEAVVLRPVESGEIRTKQTRYGFPLVLGHLFSGEGASARIVREVRKEADRFESELQFIDSSPGTGSPVIAALQGVTFAILVTEPTPAGLSDASRIFEVIRHFKVPWGLVVNKWDLNAEETKKIEDWAGDKVLGRISYDNGVMKAAVDRVPVMEAGLKIIEEIREVYNKLNERIEKGGSVG